jgi:hypothetical protein
MSRMNTNSDPVIVEQAARERWKTDASIRHEFLNDLESYIAYEKAVAMGVAKILCWPGDQKR